VAIRPSAKANLVIYLVRGGGRKNFRQQQQLLLKAAALCFFRPRSSSVADQIRNFCFHQFLVEKLQELLEVLVLSDTFAQMYRDTSQTVLWLLMYHDAWSRSSFI
jgi:hypothetical protein